MTNRQSDETVELVRIQREVAFETGQYVSQGAIDAVIRHARTTTPVDAGLVERLRAYRGGTTEWRELMDEAATALEAIVTTPERAATTFCGVCGGEFDAAEWAASARCPECEEPKSLITTPIDAGLVELLEPFVPYLEDWMKDEAVWPDDVQTSVFRLGTFGQLRKARAALEAIVSSPVGDAK